MRKSTLPNIFTFSNLSLGVFSLMMTFKANYLWASLFIIIAALIDRYDGRIARYFQVSSDLGKELDSLADLVSFGVAPALLMCNLYNYTNLGIIGYFFVILFPIAGAYRLARYNSNEFDNVFTGVPITVAGCALAFFSLINLNANAKMDVFTSYSALALVIQLVFAYLMISKIKIKKV